MTKKKDKKEKKEKVNFELMVEEINEFAKKTKDNRFHKKENPVKILIKEPKKEQKVENKPESHE
ncbi:MAG: hypothetical protein ACOC0C_04155 [Bacteroidota bacterium]